MTAQRFVVIVLLIATPLVAGISLVGNQELRLAVRPSAPPSLPGISTRYLPMVISSSQDTGWAGGFNLPGMDENVYATVFAPDGSLFVGGQFTTAGDVVAKGIARWNGTTWHSLGSGIGDGGVPAVYALAVGLDGSLYAGGRFTSVGGIEVNHVARWDGTTWHPLSTGMSETSDVRSLAVGPDGSLYAGGAFTTAGGVTVNNIGRWDGTTWHSLGNGVNDFVLALTFGSDGSLYAGGQFTTAGGIEANHVARWDGTTWHPLGSGINEYGDVNALAVGSDGSVYAGGSFTTAGGVAVNNVARWDGTTWFALSSGINDGYVKALAMGSGGELFAAGSFAAAGDVAANNVACWDGLTWDPLGSGIEGSFVSALAFGSDDALYAGGLFSIADGVPSSNIARWGELSPSTVTLASFRTGMTKHTIARVLDLIVLSILAVLAGAALMRRFRGVVSHQDNGLEKIRLGG